MEFFRGIADTITQNWKGFQTRPNLRQAYLRVSAAGAPPPHAFEPEKCYLSLRVVELRLAEAGAYLTNYLPMCACFLREGQVETMRTLPVVIGAETIRSGLGAATPGNAGHNLAIVNMDLVRNMPVRAGGLMLYTSLCRFRDDSLSRGLLSFAAEAAKAVGGEAAAMPVRVAGDLTGKLQGLLGSGGVETRFARLDGDALQESGYRLLAASSNGLDGPLAVRDGMVVKGAGADELSIDDVDYLLLEFRHVPSLVDAEFAAVSHLPFHKQFEAAEQAVIAARGQKSAVADDCMIKLEQEIFASPALVRRDRLWLVQVYNAARRKLEASFKSQLQAGDDMPELSALSNRSDQESVAGSAIAPILGAATSALGSVLVTERESMAEQPTNLRELGSIASSLMAALPLEDYDDDTIGAAAVAYTGTLRGHP